MKTHALRLLASALFAVIVVGCSEKADEAAVPMAPDSASRSGQAAKAPATIAGIPETGHFQSSGLKQDEIAAKTNTGVCSVENVVTVTDETPATGDAPNRYRVRRDLGYRLVGFIVDKEAGTVPTDVELVLAGAKVYGAALSTGRPRGDVAEYFDNPAFAQAGFLEDMAFARVERGDYAIYVFDRTSGDFCTTNQSVTVVD